MQHSYKIDQNGSDIDENVPLERFRRQVAPRISMKMRPWSVFSAKSRPGCSTEFGGVTLARLNRRKCRSKGRFLDP